VAEASGGGSINTGGSSGAQKSRLGLGFVNATKVRRVGGRQAAWVPPQPRAGLEGADCQGRTSKWRTVMTQNLIRRRRGRTCDGGHSATTRPVAP
jgi:hypothetical protein